MDHRVKPGGDERRALAGRQKRSSRHNPFTIASDGARKQGNGR